MNNSSILSKINQLQDISSGKIWIGTNYSKLLSKINAQEAFSYPLVDIHSIAEILSHLTCWRNETILKITTGKGSITDDSELNWLAKEELQKLTWKTILDNYNKSLREIVNLLENQDDLFLSEKYYDNDFKDYYDYEFLINGVIHHDLYHLGQVAILIKKIKK